jgi:hypothetical protein
MVKDITVTQSPLNFVLKYYTNNRFIKWEIPFVLLFNNFLNLATTFADELINKHVVRNYSA